MDFFQQQQNAKRASRRLLVLFFFCLFILVLLVNLGFLLVWSYIDSDAVGSQQVLQSYWRSPLPLYVSLATLLVFSAGSFHRLLQLSGNNIALAEMVNAVEVTEKNASADEKVFINVAEEMAVASGVAMPRLFVMQREDSINAFVTGAPGDYVLVVTRGAIKQLTRDELQAVMGHEFSHLLNGDVTLNLRMLVILAGLLAVSRVGKVLMYSAFSHSQPRHRRPQLTTNNKDSGGALFLLAGLVLLLAGYCGLLLGRVIKAAVSRQREVLADASSVQFTRSPSALANALIKIQHSSDPLLSNRYAEDVNHMCFSDTVHISFRAVFATHPNIETRLRNLGDEWVARERIRRHRKLQQAQGSSAVINAESLGYAQHIVESIPKEIKYILSEPEGACLVLYALVISRSKRAKMPKIKHEQKKALPNLITQVKGLGPSVYIPLVDLSLPAVQRLDQQQFKQLINQLDVLIKADGHITIFEYLLRQLVRFRLSPMKPPKPKYTQIHEVSTSLNLIFSTLIHQSSSRPEEQHKLYLWHVSPLLKGSYGLVEKEQCKLKELALALKEMRALSSFVKNIVMDVCVDIVMDDQVVKVEELEVLRLVSLLTDSLLPPLKNNAA